MSDLSNSSSTAGATAERYKLLEVIGSGSFGDVYRALDTATDGEVAVKVVDLEDVGEELADVQQEISMLRACRSPNIVECHGAVAVPGTARLLVVMELMAASLADLVSPDTGGAPLPEPHIAYVLREVLNALVYLHSEHRIHRDVKAANVLLSRDGMVKVSDFGVSAQLCGTVGFKRRTFVGSPLWMAPEVIEQSPDLRGGELAAGGGVAGQEGYDEAADIWSLGITAIEMALGEPPRSGLPSFRLLFVIVREPPPRLDAPFSAQLRDFVAQCLAKRPGDRPSAIDLLMHPFVATAERPPDMPARIAAFLASRPPPAAAGAAHGRPGSNLGTVVSKAGGAGGGDASAAVGGGWDFGTVRAALPIQGTGTVRHVPAAPPAAPGRHIEIPAAPSSPGLASACASSRPAQAHSPLQHPQQAQQAASPAPAAEPARQSFAGSKPRLPPPAPAAPAVQGLVAAALARLHAAGPAATSAALEDVLQLLSPGGGQAASSSASGGKRAKAPALPDLGPLGSLLLARWEEGAARGRAPSMAQPSNPSTIL